MLWMTLATCGRIEGSGEHGHLHMPLAWHIFKCQAGCVWNARFMSHLHSKVSAVLLHAVFCGCRSVPICCIWFFPHCMYACNSKTLVCICVGMHRATHRLCVACRCILHFLCCLVGSCTCVLVWLLWLLLAGISELPHLGNTVQVDL